MEYHKRKVTTKLMALLIPIIMVQFLQTEIVFCANNRFLGITVEPHQKGLVIKQVIPGTPATKAVDTSNGHYISLEPGDVIQSVNGVIVKHPANLVQLLQQGPPIAVIKVWDIRYNLYRTVAAGVGTPNEITVYLKQRSQNFKSNSANSMPSISVPSHIPTTTYRMTEA